MKHNIRMGLYGCNMYRTRDLMNGVRSAAGDKVKIVACLDIDRAKAEFASQQYGGDVYTDEAAFLKHDMDVVMICLPPYLHADAFAHAAAAGKDVYLEKPICVDQVGREKILRAAAKYPVKCYVGLSYRYIEPFRKVAEILRRPDAGKIIGIHHHWMAPWVREPENPGWRHRLDQSGGQLIHHCCHYLDWLWWVGGDIDSVTATSYTPPGVPLPHEERELTASFAYHHGGQAVFNLSQHTHQYIQYGSVHTENLGIHYQWGKETFVRVYQTRSRAVDETFEFSMTDAPGDGGEAERNTRQMKDFIETYLKNEPMSLGVTEGIRTFDLACAARESYRTGQRILVNTKTITRHSK